MMNFKEIDYILAIAKYNTISKAAKSLYIAQPALSKFLSNLEIQLGFTLFERGGSTLSITEAGRIYVKHALAIQKEIYSLDQELKALLARVSATINIGISLNASLLKIADFKGALHNRFPSYSLNLVSLHHRQLYEGLLNNTLDAGIAASPMEPSLKFDRFFELPFLVMVPHSRSLELSTRDIGAEYPWINIQELTGFSLVLQNKNTYIRQEFDTIFQQQRLRFSNVLLEVESSLHAITYAEQLNCMAFISPSFLPYLSADADFDFYTWGEPLATTNLGLIYKAGKSFTPQETFCIQLLRSYMEKNMDGFLPA